MSFIIYQLLESDPTCQVGSLSSKSVGDEWHGDDDDEWVWYDRYESVPVSAKGRVEHQKLNQTAP